MAYLFKDTDLAARRLRVLADVFAPASRAFLLDMVNTEPELALDLGFSTIEEIEQELHDLAQHSTAEGEIEWGMRQVAYERV
jgi:hypothetical protein